MVQFIQQVFLSPFLIFMIILTQFVLMSAWAIRHRHEYVGYGLGWLFGLFGMVIYGALVGDVEAVTTPTSDVQIRLNLFQVTIPSLLGIVIGIWMMSLIVKSRKSFALRTMIVAVLTALFLWLMFALSVSAPYPETQRMIGLFTLAFGIGALSMMAVLRQGGTAIPSSTSYQDRDKRAGRDLPSQRQVPTANIEDDQNTNRFNRR